MQVQVVNNRDVYTAPVLASAIEAANDIRIAVAFVSQRGLAMIEEPLAVVLGAGASIEFLVGLDMRTTEPAALQRLHDLARQSDGVALYCYADLAPAAVYHPKLYLMRYEDSVTAVVGSSNLTEGGLKRNVEVNLSLQGTLAEKPLADLYETYYTLKFHPLRVAPDEEFLALYQSLCEREKKRAVRDPATREVQTAFAEKVKTLRRPVPTAKDLVGWLRLVYEALPDGEFTNQQVYAHERIFQQRYPDNQHVSDKIRQQLQVLRDMGLIEHLGTARWRKK